MQSIERSGIRFNALRTWKENEMWDPASNWSSPLVGGGVVEVTARPLRCNGHHSMTDLINFLLTVVAMIRSSHIIFCGQTTACLDEFLMQSIERSGIRFNALRTWKENEMWDPASNWSSPIRLRSGEKFAQKDSCSTLQPVQKGRAVLPRSRKIQKGWPLLELGAFCQFASKLCHHQCKGAVQLISQPRYEE